MKSTLKLLLLAAVLLSLTAAQAAATVHQAPDCTAPNPLTASLLAQTSPGDWAGWIRRLSGADPVRIQGTPLRITTRFEAAMEQNLPQARVIPYLVNTLQAWYPAEQVQVESFSYYSGLATGKNVVLTLPGVTIPGEEVLLTAHMDDTAYDTNKSQLAPGAEDNASGVAALLEAARLFRQYRFARTVKLVWFGAEEIGLQGSSAYAASHDLSGVVGVINLDMFGYDADDDHCFELHVGTLASSQVIGQCFADSIGAYNLDLKYDFLTAETTGRSDHASFWPYGVGAIEVLENNATNNQPGGCVGSDASPYYHRSTDTVDKLNLASGGEIVKAALAAGMALAEPLDACFNSSPALQAGWQSGTLALDVGAVDGATGYRVLRSFGGCDTGDWQVVNMAEPGPWADPLAVPYASYGYQVEAEGNGCVSSPSACVLVPAQANWPEHLYLAGVYGE